MRYSCVGSLLLAGCLASSVPLFAAVEIVDEIVCKVNDQIITRSDLEQDRKDLEEKFRTAGGLTGSRLQEEVKKAMPDLLRDRIDTLLLVARAKELDLKVDTEVTKRLAELQLRSGIADPEKFQATIREQYNMPYEDFKGKVKDDLLRQRVIGEEISRKILFKREELEAYYNDHKDEFIREERVFLRDILISTQGKDAAGIAASEKKAKDLVARARKGEKFPELAQQNSDDSNTAQDGGALYPQKKEELIPEIVAAVWAKDKGYVTDPIQRPNGFLILKVDDHPKAGLAQFEEVENDVQNKLMQPRMEPAYRAYLTKLRESAFLEIKPGWEDSGAAPGKDTAWVNTADFKPETVKKEDLLKEGHRKHLLGIIPIPGSEAAKTGTSSSK
jgi:peptidyl-prolyl cis-trans isomerase SurA